MNLRRIASRFKPQDRFRRKNGGLLGCLRKLQLVLLAILLSVVFGSPAFAASTGFEKTLYLLYGQDLDITFSIDNCTEYLGSGYLNVYSDLYITATYSGEKCYLNVTGTVTDEADSYFVQDFAYNTYEGSAAQLRAYIYVYVNDAIKFKGGTLDDGMVNSEYSDYINSASKGSGSFSYAVTSGSLPDGLSLNSSTGKVSGTPTTVTDETSFTVTATDTKTSGNPTATATYKITINPAVPVLSNSSTTVDPNTEDQDLTLDVSGATPTSYTITSGPSHGTAKTSSSGITYTPTAGYSGSDSITYYATAAAGDSESSATVSITVNKPTLAISPTSLDDATVGFAYTNVTFTASLGTADYTYELETGYSLPDGMSFSNGVLSGTPTEDGSFPFTVKATDVYGATGEQSYTLVVGRPTITLSPTTLDDGVAADEYSQTFTASGGVASYTYAVTSGSLPTGLSLSTGGKLSGTLTYVGTYNFTVTATDSYGSTGSQAYSVEVTGATLTMTPDPLPEGMIAIAYSQELGVSGGMGPYTITHTGGDLPDGVTYDAGTKMLAGTSTVFGTYALTFALADATGSKATVNVDLAISDLPDPTKDAEVTGLVTAQIKTARRFARQQMSNVNDHLSQLHDRSRGLRSRFGAGVSYNTDTRETASSRAPGEQAAPGAGGFIATHGNAADDQGFADAFNQFTQGRAAVWTAGSVDFGSRALGGNDSEDSHVSLALSAGFDYAVSKSLVAGFAVGINKAHTTVTDNGTKTDAEGASLTGYASWNALPDVYIDGLVGYGVLSFDNTRYVTTTGDYATGDRDGQQAFASLTATYDGQLGSFDLAPYARLQASRSWLEDYTERGAGAFNLHYGDQTVDSLTGAFGMSIARTFVTSEGSFAPRLKLEYGHEFADASDMTLTYLASPTVYSLSTDDERKDYGTVGIGLDLLTLDEATRIALDYSISFDADGVRNQPISFKFSHAF